MELILKFLQSPVGMRIKNNFAGLRREYTFSVLVPSQELLPEEGTEETILLQGAIDCWFEEDGKVILVDYKTDRAADEQAFTETYRPQLKWYAEAVSELTGKPVKETWLYAIARQECSALLRPAPYQPFQQHRSYPGQVFRH